MEKRVKARFYEMIDRYRENKHEFDDESLALLHDVYGEAYKAGYEDGKQDCREQRTIDNYSTWKEPGVQAF